MATVATVIRKESWDVEARLAEMDLNRTALLRVREIALSAAADATPFHPANAWGTFAYQSGTWAMRNEFVGQIWALDRPDGVEVISNETRKLKIIFANVDVASSEDQKPVPRSRKGGGAERVCMGNLFGTLPTFAPKQEAGWRIYYLLVDENGAAELTCPVVKNGKFKSFIERIFLSDGNDLERIPRTLDDGDVADGFEPEVARKQ